MCIIKKKEVYLLFKGPIHKIITALLCLCFVLRTKTQTCILWNESRAKKTSHVIADVVVNRDWTVVLCDKSVTERLEVKICLEHVMISHEQN